MGEASLKISSDLSPAAPSRVRRFLVSGLVLCSLVAVGWFAYDAITSGILSAEIRWPLLGTSALVQLASVFFLALCWQRILNTLWLGWHSAPAVRALSIRAYGRSWLARYIPGKVWMFGGRLVLGQHLGVPASTMARSMGLEAFFSYALLSVLGVALLLGALVHLLVAVAVAVLGVITVSLVPVLLNAGQALHGNHLLTVPLRRISSVLIGERPLRASFIGWAVVAYSVHALLKLAFIVLLALSFLDLSTSQAAIVAGVWAISLLAGYLVVLAPAGLGVRDGVALGLLVPVLGAPAAGVVVAGSRVILVVADIVFVALVELATLRTTSGNGSGEVRQKPTPDDGRVGEKRVR